MLPVSLERWLLTGWWSNRAKCRVPLCIHLLCSGSGTIVNHKPNTKTAKCSQKATLQRHWQGRPRRPSNSLDHERSCSGWRCLGPGDQWLIWAGEERADWTCWHFSEFNKRNRKCGHPSRCRQSGSKQTQNETVPVFTSTVVNGTTTASVSTSLTWMQNLSDMRNVHCVIWD